MRAGLKQHEKVSATATLLVAFSGMPSWAVGPSFDCRLALDPLAKIICGNSDLSRLDLQFNQAYQILREQVGASKQVELRQEAIDFQRQAIASCGVPAAKSQPPLSFTGGSCLDQAYGEQRRRWLSRLQGPALEEASRPIEQHVALQSDLITLGLLMPPNVADGVYGTATRAAIKSWQHSMKLPETALIGEADATALQQAVAALPAGVPAGLTNSSQMTSSESSVLADQKAKHLAYEASNGSPVALTALEDGAGKGVPSLQFGLGWYYKLLVQRHAPIAYTTALDDYARTNYPDFERSISEAEARRPAHDFRVEYLLRSEITYLQKAARSRDPAAEEALGVEYWGEVGRSQALIWYVSPERLEGPSLDPQIREFVAVYQHMCKSGRDLLSSSMAQGWPDAFLTMGLYLGQDTPQKVMVLRASGCYDSDPVRSRYLAQEAAGKGSPDAIFSLMKSRLEDNP